MHHKVRENIIILVIIPNSKYFCSARHECPSIIGYVFFFYPQIAWFHISHIQYNLKEITETNPAY